MKSVLKGIFTKSSVSNESPQEFSAKQEQGYSRKSRKERNFSSIAMKLAVLDKAGTKIVAGDHW